MTDYLYKFLVFKQIFSPSLSPYIPPIFPSHIIFDDLAFSHAYGQEVDIANAKARLSQALRRKEGLVWWLPIQKPKTNNIS